ncbi:GNAT family N-acetyltransferase [Piscibacillus halophilus]|uniref:Protein N-acetyltransferase, RimJ/RimL family n=1 Tax=Piscibacillus halophilus TaxID=571933 RepID=A0A1H9IXY4_9BACI|nr:GNAT family N-acetyltransferase [Piscibacillus halophilus]SEQ79367.1 Protein N-acetyltransferase, RimJ/RimL family [Piscibacillus halophilus]
MDLNLSTNRLHLRPFTIDDAPRVYELASDRAIYETTLNIPQPYTLDTAKDWINRHHELIDKGEIYPFAIILKDQNLLIGAMSIRVDRQHKRGELAYWVGKSYWSQGYATEAAERVTHFAQNELLIHKVWAQALTINPASSKVMIKLGMEKEGTLAEHYYKDGKFLDVDVYGKVFKK